MKIESNLPTTIDVDAELDRLAKRYKQAGGLGISVLNLVGGSADSLLKTCSSSLFIYKYTYLALVADCFF